MSTKGKSRSIKQNRTTENCQNNLGCSTDEEKIIQDKDILRYNLDLVNTWIANLDTKVSISCGIFSIVIAIVVFSSENYFDNLGYSEIVHMRCLYAFVVFAILAGVTFLISIILHFIAITPNLLGGKKKKGEKTEKSKPQYSIFYENISKFENVDYSVVLKAPIRQIGNH